VNDRPRWLYPKRLSSPPSLRADIRIGTRPCPRCGSTMVVCCASEDEDVHWLCLGCSRRTPYNEKENA